MHFGLNQEQTILRNEARRFLKNECPVDLVREMMEDEKGYSASLWKKMAELGWMGLLFEEDYGGSGGDFFDLSILLEETGRVLLPGPFFSTVVLSGMALVEGGDEKIKQKILPSIAKGDLIVTVALTETEGSYSLEEIESKAEPRDGGFILRGRKMFVPHAHIADCILIPARTHQRGYPDGISLFMVDRKDKGLTVSPLVTLDLQKQHEVGLTDAYTSKDSVVGKVGEGWILIQKLWPSAVAGKCCEMLGAMERVLEMSVDYVQNRHQFGRPLSAFQVIQHYCADMAIDLECSRFITYQAAWSVSNRLPSMKEAAMAKAWCSSAFKKLAFMAHQVHGAIAFTGEHDLHLYFRYAKAAEVTLGDANFHKEVVAAHIGL